MMLKNDLLQIGREARRLARYMFFKVNNLNSTRQPYHCPICEYKGPFADVNPVTGCRHSAQCPKCGSLERHRIQFCVVCNVLAEQDVSALRMLHFAPEKFFRDYFSGRFGEYETADLLMADVDYNVDLQELPFDDGIYDFVFASHVLEHIRDDYRALAEIRRILKPTGVAVLPVPLVAEQTVEYPEPNSFESYHVRAPGFDYYDRYRQFFSTVQRYPSDFFPEKYQLYIWEDRTKWPTDDSPYRPAMYGDRHLDVVPVCYV